MNCPVCHTSILINRELSEGLTAAKCGRCHGQWVNSSEFSKWLESHRGQPPTSSAAPSLSESDGKPKSARLCPECGRILTQYKVGYSLPFSLDRCGNCGGIWFDANEWETLQGGDLRDKIHLIFSAAWQARVRDAARIEHLNTLFAQRVGAADFAEARRIKDWLKLHPHRQELLGYLNNDEL